MTDRLPLHELTQQHLDELYFDIDNLHAAQESACGTVAKMHEAAVGEVTGPIRGVVEDVADIRARALRAEAAVAAVAVKATEWTKLAPTDDWGNTPQDTVMADIGRYLLKLMADTNSEAQR
jgi:hypothetical protein